MPTTTPTAIRDRALTVIEAITPTSDARTAFKRYRNEGFADFRQWANANAAGAYRRFQVRWTGADDLVDVSNTDIERHYVNLVVIVAYPQSSRWGSGNAMDRDEVVDQDRYAIDSAIGLNGAANFTTPNPDATFMGSTITVEPGQACDFLVINQRMMYSRDVSRNAFVAAVGSNLATFIYTASGAESVAGFSIALPNPRVNTYTASVDCGAVTNILEFAVTARTTTTITVVPTGALTAGDQLFVTIEDITP